MIDIHSHVLFDIDDGAEDLDTSVDMCIDAYENGCRTLILTPHFIDYKSLHYFLDDRNERIQILRRVLSAEKIRLEILAGAELFLSDKIFKAPDLNDLTINGTRYMLCEMPLGPFNTRHMTRWFEELFDRGYTPILAHPERYYEFHQDYSLVDDLINLGVLFQVNLDSLIGANGPEAQGMGIDMVYRGFAQFIASDAHDLIYRHTRLLEKLDYLPDEIDENIIEKCLKTNPEKLIKNQPI